MQKKCQSANKASGKGLDVQDAPTVAQARAAHPVIDQMLTMREELRQLWLNTTLSREQLTSQLQAWCQRAEASGIAALKDFSVKLRAAQA